MKIDEKIVDRLNNLISNSNDVINTKYDVEGIIDFDGSRVDREKAHQWAVSCLNLLKRVFGEESDHYQKFNEIYSKFNYLWAVKTGLGILKAAKDDYENGYLFDTRVLIEAEVFNEFLEQAEHLLNQGYDQPAAAIAGSVLEDGLRKLCTKYAIVLSAKPKLDTMNADLAKAGVYNLLKQKQITALADLRNKAAHGLGGFTKEDVEGMIRDVRRFMEDYFS
jgi:hypothetical protein